MSASPPKADMCSAIAHVCFGPKADIQDGYDRSSRNAIAAMLNMRGRGRFVPSGLPAGSAIQNNNPDHGRDHQRATESRCQCPVIYCRDLHVCRLGGAANAICEVGHIVTANLPTPEEAPE